MTSYSRSLSFLIFQHNSDIQRFNICLLYASIPRDAVKFNRGSLSLTSLVSMLISSLPSTVTTTPCFLFHALEETKVKHPSPSLFGLFVCAHFLFCFDRSNDR